GAPADISKSVRGSTARHAAAPGSVSGPRSPRVAGADGGNSWRGVGRDALAGSSPADTRAAVSGVGMVRGRRVPGCRLPGCQLPADRLPSRLPRPPVPTEEPLLPPPMGGGVQSSTVTVTDLLLTISWTALRVCEPVVTGVQENTALLFEPGRFWPISVPLSVRVTSNSSEVIVTSTVTV